MRRLRILIEPTVVRCIDIGLAESCEGNDPIDIIADAICMYAETRQVMGHSPFLPRAGAPTEWESRRWERGVWAWLEVISLYDGSKVELAVRKL